MYVHVGTNIAQITTGSTLIVEQDKALHGCIESAHLWLSESTSTLKNLGFTENDCDKFVFTRRRKGVRTTVMIYVGDVSRFKSHITAVIHEVEKRCDKLRVSIKPIHSYLGMVFDFTTKDQVAVNDFGMIEDSISTTHTDVAE